MSDEQFRPRRLAEKLLAIRMGLDLSQNEMLHVLGLKDGYDRAFVSFWETDKRQPPLGVVLRYARAYGVSTDFLLDDNFNLPPPAQIQLNLPSRKRRRRSSNSS
jgi:transcriptional regulator with XRE-family HTH domain